jgi:hypothetical protein
MFLQRSKAHRHLKRATAATAAAATVADVVADAVPITATVSGDLGRHIAAVVDLATACHTHLTPEVNAHVAALQADEAAALPGAPSLLQVAQAMQVLHAVAPRLDMAHAMLATFRKFLTDMRVVMVGDAQLLFALQNRCLLGSWDQALATSLRAHNQTAWLYLEARKDRATAVIRQCSVATGTVNLHRVCLAPADAEDSVVDIARTVIPAAGAGTVTGASPPQVLGTMMHSLAAPAGTASRVRPFILVPGCVAGMEFINFCKRVLVGDLGVVAGHVLLLSDVATVEDLAALGRAMATNTPVIVQGRGDGLVPPLLSRDPHLRLFVVHLRSTNTPRVQWDAPGVARQAWDLAIASSPFHTCPMAFRPAPMDRDGPGEDVALLAEAIQEGFGGLRIAAAEASASADADADADAEGSSSATGSGSATQLVVLGTAYAEYRRRRGFYHRCAGGGSILPWSRVGEAMQAVLGPGAPPTTRMMVVCDQGFGTLSS